MHAVIQSIYRRSVPWGYRQWLRAYKPNGPLRRLRTAPDAEDYCLSPFDENRCIFVHIPKTAGISLCTALFDCKGGGHLTARAYRALFGTQAFEEYFKFTFVRNPWDRIVSAFTYLSQGGGNERDAAWGQAVLAQYRSFDEFVLQWLDPRSVYSQIHFVPQWEFVVNGQGQVCMDFVGRFERLADDFQYVADQLGCACELPLVNASRRLSYRDYYTEASRRRVAQVYRRDIEQFGYCF
jgi:hypothetical protein